MKPTFLFCLLAGAALASDFPTPFNTEKGTNGPMSAVEAAAQAKLPPGFRITVFAAEPDVQQPIGMALDSRGRLWVAENYTYAERPVRWEPTMRDRILMFEDQDNDGHFDKRTVFWEGGQHLTSVLPGYGGVFALALPQLLFIPDRNGDGIPDGPPEVVLDGFEFAVSGHTVANGLKWGPDGWLYGQHGIQGTSLLGPPGTPDSGRVAMNVGVWRYHPTRHVVEVVTQGTTNPWGMDWNEYGEAFHINTVIGHLWHAIPGVHVRRMYGEDRNPHIYHVIEQTADHVHWDTRETWSDVRKLGVTEASSLAGGGHAHTGLMFYGGDNWPDEYRGKLFTVNYHGKRINSDNVIRAGSGYVGKHGQDFALFADPWFRGLDMIYGPDGGVYLSDWSDTGECHDNDGIHRTSGRIFKITYGTPAKPAVADVSKLSEPELVKLLTHKNEWYAREARLTLQERAAQNPAPGGRHDELRQLFAKGGATVEKLRALWALHVVNAADADFLRAQLASTDEYIRTWAIRLLLDDPSRAEARTFSALIELAKKETAASVRLTLASALQRVPLSQRAALAAPLLAHAEDAGDHSLPLMLWFGLEPLGDSEPQTLARLAQNCALPDTRLCMTRRITEEIEKNPAPLDTVLVASLKQSAAFQGDILTGITEALAGWRKAPKPSSWDAASAAFAKSADAKVRDLARDLSAVFGDGRALDSVRALALDDKRDAAARRSALRTLISARVDGLRALCEKLFEVRDLAATAADGLALSDDPAAATFMINRFGRLQPHEKPAVVNALVARPASVKLLLDAIDKGKIARNDLTPFHLRSIRALNNTELTARLRQVWGEFRDSDADKLALIAKWKARLTPAVLAQADRAKGHEVFKAVCATCHKLYGEGAAIAPDLTGSGRDNLDYLLQNIGDPSAVVPAEYFLSTVTMKDSRVLSGIIRSRTAKTIGLQTISEIITLDAADVQNIETSRLSMMPEGLLEALDETQVRNLIAFLMTKQ